MGECLSIRFACGHSNKFLALKDEIRLCETIDGWGVPEGRGKRAFFVRFIYGWVTSKNPLYPFGVIKEYMMDKRGNWYKEKVVDANNVTNVIIDQSEPLSEHQGHGSAKRKA